MNTIKSDYDEVSPITGTKCVLVEEVEEGLLSKICMESGYTTFIPSCHPDNPIFEEFEKTLPDFIRERAFIDEFGFRWYLSIINVPPAGMLFPEPDEDSFIWIGGKFIDIVDTDTGEHQFEFDWDNAGKYAANDFSSAMDDLSAIMATYHSMHHSE